MSDEMGADLRLAYSSLDVLMADLKRAYAEQDALMAEIAKSRTAINAVHDLIMQSAKDDDRPLTDLEKAICLLLLEYYKP